VFAGDETALGALFERHSGRVYDFALRLLRDPAGADDVVQTTFVNAWKHMKKRRVQGNIRAWLLSIARNGAIDAMRSRRRHERHGGVSIDDVDFAAIDPSRYADPEQYAQHREVADLVWEAAASLTPTEYALLDLHLRQGLDADDLARRLGSRKGSVNVRLFRLRGSLRKSVLATLLWRHPGDCAFIAGLKETQGGGALNNSTRKLLLGHIDECDVCKETSRRFVNPVQTFAGLLAIPLPEASRAPIWEAIAAMAGGAAAGVAAGAAVAGGIGGKVAAFGGWVGRNVRNVAVGGSAAAAAAAVATTVALVVAGGDSPVRGPNDVRAVGIEAGGTTDDETIRVEWSPRSGVLGYSVEWTNAPDTVPDETADLPGDARVDVSPPLENGTWYFHMRTQDADGEWSDPTHLGPFIVGADDAPPQGRVLAATQVPSSTATRALTPSPAPTSAPVQPVAPAAEPTASLPAPPTVAPSATPSPAATATAGSGSSGARATATRTSTGGSAPSATPTSGATLTPAPSATATRTADASCDGRAPTIAGTDADDLLEGTPGDDVISGLGGDDTIDGHGGDDVLCGGAGDDVLVGGADDDTISGGTGDDVLAGHTGDDDLDGGSGSDDCQGGTGDDTAAGCETVNGIP
jgi:RNA polymerase sigma factor (sigma-70 family)